MTDIGRDGIENALQLVGELLMDSGHRYHIVVIGGAALNLSGLVLRATEDVDILAFAKPDSQGVLLLRPPDEPLPAPLAAAATTVAGDLGLDPHWLNTGPASQWKTGLPPGLAEGIVWRRYGGLSVGLVDRTTQIFFKLYASADDVGPRSVHFQDLLALAPNAGELDAAGRWVRDQDPSPAFARVVSEVIKRAKPS